jgi:hypothetical protein
LRFCAGWNARNFEFCAKFLVDFEFGVGDFFFCDCEKIHFDFGDFGGNFVEFLVKEVRNGKIDYTSPPVAPQCSSTYASESTSLSLVNSDGERECIYYQRVNNVGQVLVAKQGVAAQNILSTNFDIDPTSFKFFVRPGTDPYTAPYPKVQPFVMMTMIFKVVLPTKEMVTIPYQTTVSTEVYDVPR